MKINPLEIVGKKFNNFLVLEYIGKGKYSVTMYKAQCDCGNIVKKSYAQLVGNKGKTCSKCFKGRITHGMSYTHLNKIWRDIKTRTNPSNYKSNIRNYRKYNVKICDEWKNSFISFYNWSINNGYKDEKLPNGRHKYTIDRINPKGNYSPENCRWVTNKEQARNKTNHIYLEYNGEIKKLFEWCEYLNIPYKRTHRRLRDGWDTKRAFEEKRWNTFKSKGE